MFNIEIFDWWGGDFLEVDLVIVCGIGIYIWVIVCDLGIILNIGGILVVLIRKESSGFFEENSFIFLEVEN